MTETIALFGSSRLNSWEPNSYTLPKIKHKAHLLGSETGVCDDMKLKEHSDHPKEFSTNLELAGTVFTLGDG